MRWVCKQPCVWRDAVWEEGDFIDVVGVSKWAYSGGFWHPAKLDKVQAHQLIPRHFEPERLGLVKRSDILIARSGVRTEPNFTLVKNVVEEPTPEMVLDEQLAIEREQSNLPDTGD
jgi:hypothetical protein